MLKQAAQRMVERLLGAAQRATAGRLARWLREWWAALLYLIAFMILTSGFLAVALEGVPLQFSVYSLFVILTGAFGTYLAYQGGLQSVRGRIATFYLILGLVLLLIASITGLYLVDALS
jgi:cytochrome b561